jgi:hypothetical protein
MLSILVLQEVEYHWAAAKGEAVSQTSLRMELEETLEKHKEIIYKIGKWWEERERMTTVVSCCTHEFDHLACVCAVKGKEDDEDLLTLCTHEELNSIMHILSEHP